MERLNELQAIQREINEGFEMDRKFKEYLKEKEKSEKNYLISIKKDTIEIMKMKKELENQTWKEQKKDICQELVLNSSFFGALWINKTKANEKKWKQRQEEDRKKQREEQAKQKIIIVQENREIKKKKADHEKEIMVIILIKLAFKRFLSMPS